MFVFSVAEPAEAEQPAGVAAARRILRADPDRGGTTGCSPSSSERPSLARLERIMLERFTRRTFLTVIVAFGALSSAHAQQTGQLNGVYGPVSGTPLSSTLTGPSSLPSTPVAPSNSPMNSVAATPGAILPAGTATSPAPYGPTGYGQAWVNGRTVLFDRSNNRVVGILH